MKKLMMAVAIVCAAVAANAATVQWKSGTLFGAKNADGGKGTKLVNNSAVLADGTTVAMNLWLVDATEYGKYVGKDQSAIYEVYNGKSGAITQTGTGSPRFPTTGRLSRSRRAPCSCSSALRASRSVVAALKFNLELVPS